jgi:hypothetical protein
VRHFVFDPQAIAVMEARCEFVRDLEDGWTREYREPNTGALWHAQPLHAEQHGGGLPYWARLPLPDTPALLALALHAPALDDRLVAAHLLSGEPETWAALVEGWEPQRPESESTNWMAAAVRATGMLAAINWRSTLGKAPAEIDRDYAHFRELARRAAALVAQAEVGASDA